MPAYTESLNRLIDEFSKLPGIGRKTAERLAYHILVTRPEEAYALAKTIQDVKENVRNCADCFNFAEGELCDICKDPRRDKSLLCVVEQPKDVIAIEKTGAYKGVYHVLMGRLAPLDGMHPDNLTIQKLLDRVESGGFREAILATNPDLEGDGTALYIREKLEAFNLIVSRIATGLPAGSALEYAGKNMLQDAMEYRREMRR